MQTRQRTRGAWWLAGAVTLTAILATPYLLELVALDGKDWDRLSSISQTYSALSALFSAAALLGVVASVA